MRARYHTIQAIRKESGLGVIDLIEVIMVENRYLYRLFFSFDNGYPYLESLFVRSAYPCFMNCVKVHILGS